MSCSNKIGPIFTNNGPYIYIKLKTFYLITLPNGGAEKLGGHEKKVGKVGKTLLICNWQPEPNWKLSNTFKYTFPNKKIWVFKIIHLKKIKMSKIGHLAL